MEERYECCAAPPDDDLECGDNYEIDYEYWDGVGDYGDDLGSPIEYRIPISSSSTKKEIEDKNEIKEIEDKNEIKEIEDKNEIKEIDDKKEIKEIEEKKKLKKLKKKKFNLILMNLS